MSQHYLDGVLNVDDEAIRWLDRTRDGWRETMRPERHDGRPEPGPLLHHAPIIPQELVVGARMFTDRYTAINSLPQGGRIAEVGTQEGWFARHMLEMLKPEALHVFDIDLSPAETSGSAILGDTRIVAHLGDSAEKLAALPDDYFDIIYIDADHCYRGVKRDADVAARKIRPGGHLVFNDYIFWSVNEFTGYGVVRACNELTIERQWPWAYFALHPMMHCDVAVRRPSQ